jgi:hypothetical protein
MSIIAKACCVLTALLFVSGAAAARFGTRAETEPANIDEISDVLPQDHVPRRNILTSERAKRRAVAAPHQR